MNMVGDYTRDQFYQVKVYTKRDEDCAECVYLMSHLFLCLLQCLSGTLGYGSEIYLQNVLLQILGDHA